MSESFEALVRVHGPIVWDLMREWRGRLYHGGAPCPLARPSLLGGEKDCTPECARHFNDHLMELGRRRGLWKPTKEPAPAVRSLGRPPRAWER